MPKNKTELSIPLDESQYEWVELPSKGECYPHKKSRVPVAYLTATDENIIVSKELRSKRKVSDTLLERKILDKSFNVKDLCIDNYLYGYPYHDKGRDNFFKIKRAIWQK